MLVTCFCVHSTFSLDTPSYIFQFILTASSFAVYAVFGASLLLFPLMGWLADVRYTRYKMIRLSFILLALCVTVLLLFGVVLIPTYQLGKLGRNIPSWCVIITALVTIIALMSVGLFEANAIQFGMDQLLAATSNQLSGFIHWYFWNMHIGLVLVYITLTALLYIFPQLAYYHRGTLKSLSIEIVLLVMAMLICCLAYLSLVFFHCCKRHFYIEKTGSNPFRLVWKVLSFAWNHKYPLRRSAFTYCEEHTLSRIDFGKEQYGGPFTYEEVEDVKTFLRLILLLASLFGYVVAGNGFSVTFHMEKYSCPSLIVWMVVACNPCFVGQLVVSVLIPVYQWLPSLQRHVPNMLKRMGIGLFLLLMQEITYTALSVLPVVNDTAYGNKTHTVLNLTTTGADCLLVRTGIVHNETLITFDDPVDDTFLWLIGPQIVNGLAQLLVNMTALEFICAQAPRTMQGLLIGIWYAMFSIKYLTSFLDKVFAPTSLLMLVYQTVRAGLVLVSLVMYLCVSRTYQYRLRDWVVNVQWMVEDVIERRIDQEDHYWREKLAEQDPLHLKHNHAQRPV